MTRILLISLFVVSCVFGLSAQRNMQPQFSISGGIGLISAASIDRAKVDTPPMILRLGWRINERYSLEAFGARSEATLPGKQYADGSIYRINNKTATAGLRGQVHFSNWERWEAYGGIQLAYQMPEVSYLMVQGPAHSTGDRTPPAFGRPASDSFVYGAFIGTSYLVNQHLAVYGEINSSVSFAQLGLRFSW